MDISFFTMTVPAPLLRKVRRDYYAKAKTSRNGGKGFPTKRSAIYGIYKCVQNQYKRRPTSDLKYQKKVIKMFARSRRIDELKKLASLERRYGVRQLGLELDTAISELGFGAMRKLNFEKERIPTTPPKTWVCY
jgi:hypothetical protein